MVKLKIRSRLQIAFFVLFYRSPPPTYFDLAPPIPPHAYLILLNAPSLPHIRNPRLFGTQEYTASLKVLVYLICSSIIKTQELR